MLYNVPGTQYTRLGGRCFVYIYIHKRSLVWQLIISTTYGDVIANRQFSFLRFKSKFLFWFEIATLYAKASSIMEWTAHWNGKCGEKKWISHLPTFADVNAQWFSHMLPRSQDIFEEMDCNK